MKSLICAAILLAASTGMANAATTVFSEDFSGSTPGTYGVGPLPGTQFSVATLNVDVVGVLNGSFFSCVQNPSGNCLDLVGNSGAGSSITSAPISLVGGQTYTLSFSDLLQGFNATDPTTSLFTVALGSFSQQFTSTGAGATESVSFVAAATDPATTLSFLDDTTPDGGHGPVLSGIVLTTPDAAPAVPEPASWALMLGGFGLVGMGMRRQPGRAVQAI